MPSFAKNDAATPPPTDYLHPQTRNKLYLPCIDSNTAVHDATVTKHEAENVASQSSQHGQNFSVIMARPRRS